MFSNGTISSLSFKLKSQLGSIGKLREPIAKSSVYETRNSKYKYTGQTKLFIKTRHKEYISQTDNNHHELSSVPKSI
jgi:hypothetical protein